MRLERAPDSCGGTRGRGRVGGLLKLCGAYVLLAGMFCSFAQMGVVRGKRYSACGIAVSVMVGYVRVCVCGGGKATSLVCYLVI